MVIQNHGVNRADNFGDWGLQVMPFRQAIEGNANQIRTREIVESAIANQERAAEVVLVWLQFLGKRWPVGGEDAARAFAGTGPNFPIRRNVAD